MKLRNKRGAQTVKQVFNNEETEVIGIVGNVGEILQLNILTSCDYSLRGYAFIYADGSKVYFGDTQEEALLNVRDY